MPIRSSSTARNMTERPVEIGATEAILAGLPDTDSLLELPSANGSCLAAREWILDIMQDINKALEDRGERVYYHQWAALEAEYSRPETMDGLDDQDVLTVGAQLPVTVWAGSLPLAEGDAAMSAQNAGEYVETIMRRTLLAIRHLLWECAADLLADGILTYEDHRLVWHEDEVEVPWLTEEDR